MHYMLDLLPSSKISGNIIKMKDIYKIKRSFRIPMVISVVLSLPILADVILGGPQKSHMIIAIFLISIFYILAINSLIRRVTLFSNGCSIRGLFGSKTIQLEEISFIDGITIGSKQYITISIPKRNYIIPNSYSNFDKITAFFCSHLKEDKLGEGIELIKTSPTNRNSDTIAAWLTAGVLIVILFIRFGFLVYN